jgi:hypothetical protein
MGIENWTVDKTGEPAANDQGSSSALKKRTADTRIEIVTPGMGSLSKMKNEEPYAPVFSSWARPLRRAEGFFRDLSGPS